MIMMKAAYRITLHLSPGLHFIYHRLHKSQLPEVKVYNLTYVITMTEQGENQKSMFLLVKMGQATLTMTSVKVLKF